MKAEENFVKDMEEIVKEITLGEAAYRSICMRAMNVLRYIEDLRNDIVVSDALEKALEIPIEDLQLLYMEWRNHYGYRPYGRMSYDTYKEFFSILEKAIPSRCPEFGVGFKAYKVLTVDFDEKLDCGLLRDALDTRCPAIATIWIPENAKRSSAFGNKCRSNEIQVTDIVIERDGEERHFDCGRSPFRSMKTDGILYCVGRTYISKFNPNRWEECADGIHFFMTEKEAIKFSNTIPWIPPTNIMTAKAKGEEDYV